MKFHPRKAGTDRFMSLVACIFLIILSSLAPVRAAGTTRVAGTVMDLEGNPIPGVKVHLESADVKGKKTPSAKVNKKGKWSYPFLDITSGRSWKVVPVHPGYMILRVVFRSVDSFGETMAQGDRILNDKQELPVIQFYPVGQGVNARGKNEVNFTLVRKEDFVEFRQRLLRERQAEKGGGPSAEEIAAQKKAEERRRKKGKEIQTFDSAVQYARNGQHENAVSAFQAFLTIEPDNEQAHYELGKSQSEIGNTEAALAEFRKTLELNPEFIGAHFRLGILYARSGRMAEAETEFRGELEQNPEDPSVLYNLGISLYEQKKFDDAITWLEKAAESDPENGRVYWMLAKIYEGRGDGPKANAQYEKFALANPEKAPAAFYNIGQDAFKKRNRKEAAIAFRKALELNPEYADAHLQLGYCLVGMAEFDNAVKHLRKFLELEPNSPQAKEIRETITQLSQ